MTTKAVQFRRGSSSETLTFTGLEGEVTVDTTKKTVVVHDEATAGGNPMAREDMSNVDVNDISNKGIAKDDLLNVSKSSITDKGIADTDLSNLTTAADGTLTKKGVVELATVSETIPGTDETRAVTPAGVNAAIAAFLGLPRLFISGMIISNNSTDPDKDVDISVGECRDFANNTDIVLASTMTKQIDVVWAAGSGNGGFPSGLTLSPNETYHLFVISNGTTVDAGFDTSLTAINLLADATGYTTYRRVGSVMTNASSNIIKFTSVDKNGSCYIEYNSLQEITSNASTTKTEYNLTIPSDLDLEVKLSFRATPSNNGALGISYYLNSGARDQRVYGAGQADYTDLETAGAMAEFDNFGLSTIYLIKNGAGTASAYVIGYTDHRQ